MRSAGGWRKQRILKLPWMRSSASSGLFSFSITWYLYICCQDNETLEPSFARAIGRGRFHEADMAWGETTAKLTYRDQRVITQTEQFKDRRC